MLIKANKTIVTKTVLFPSGELLSIYDPQWRYNILTTDYINFFNKNKKELPKLCYPNRCRASGHYADF